MKKLYATKSYPTTHEIGWKIKDGWKWEMINAADKDDAWEEAYERWLNDSIEEDTLQSIADYFASPISETEYEIAWNVNGQDFTEVKEFPNLDVAEDYAYQSWLVTALEGDALKNYAEVQVITTQKGTVYDV